MREAIIPMLWAAAPARRRAVEALGGALARGGATLVSPEIQFLVLSTRLNTGVEPWPACGSHS